MNVFTRSGAKRMRQALLNSAPLFIGKFDGMFLFVRHMHKLAYYIPIVKQAKGRIVLRPLMLIAEVNLLTS